MTAVVYATKHGATADIAHLIADGFGPNTRCVDLASGAPDVASEDLIILGTAIYAGSPLAAMKAFAERLTVGNSRLGLFVCGMHSDPLEQDKEAHAAWPPHLLDQAAVVRFLPGRYRFAAMNPAERFIIRRISKVKTDVDAISDAAVEQFIHDCRRQLRP